MTLRLGASAAPRCSSSSSGSRAADLTLTREQWVSTIHPEDLEGVVLALGAAIDSGTRFQIEYRSLLLSGQVRWLSSRAQVLERYRRPRSPRHRHASATSPSASSSKRSCAYATESLNIAQSAAGLATFDFNFGRGSRICSDNFHALLGIPPSTKLDDLDLLLSRVHPDDVARSRSAPFADRPGRALVSLRIPRAARRRRRALDRREGDGVARRRRAQWCASPAPSSTSAT